MTMKQLPWLTWFVVALAAVAHAQGLHATLAGSVVDATGAGVEGATVVLRHLATGSERQVVTRDGGRFVMPLVLPGRYGLEVSASGFAPQPTPAFTVSAGDQLTIPVLLKIAPVTSTVRVAPEGAVNTSPGVSTVIDRTFVGNLPLNGRTLQSLIVLVPGVVPAQATTDSPGQFSVNGQRTNANYMTIDGVSANIGVITDANTAQPPGQEGAGATIGVNALGGTQNLVSVDALEEFRLLSSAYSAEFGRQPGGQISLVTRSGGNRYAASALFSGRHDRFDATDWFANFNRLSKGRLRQRQIAASAGGPIPGLGQGDGPRVFFFASYEGLDITQPRVVSGNVPSLQARRDAHPAVRPLLDAYPIPTDASAPASGRVTFSGNTSDPSRVHSTGVRVDALGGPVRVFGRFSEARSSSRTGFIGLLESAVNTRTVTTAATLPGRRVASDVRVNYSLNAGPMSSLIGDVGGAAPVVFGSIGHPDLDVPPRATYSFTALGQLIGESRGRGYWQRQWNLVATTTAAFGAHTIKTGADYRHLAPSGGAMDYNLWVEFGTPDATRQAILTRGQVSRATQADVTFTNLSLFFSDAWAASSRATVEAGVRWDLNPPPRGSYYTVGGLERLDTMHVAERGSDLYATQWGNVAPRLSGSFVLRDRPSRATVLRAGGGLYYDLGAGAGAQVGGYFPFVVAKPIPAGTPYPLPRALAEPPGPPLVDAPYAGQTFIAFGPEYRTPRTWQWSVSVDQALGEAMRVSASLIGVRGSALLRRESVRDPNPLFTGNSMVHIHRSVGASRYTALQLQFDRRLRHGVQALVNYTLSSSRDTESSDVVPSLRTDRFELETEWGPSDFDVRHVFSSGVTWQIPGSGGKLSRLTNGWALDAIVRAQSAPPVGVVVIRDLGFGAFRFRPDRVPDEPLYLRDPAYPGGRIINASAFALPLEPRQGNLPRNSVRGFPLRQVDLSVRRDVRLGGVSLQFRVDSFNVLNTPNFGSPQPILGTSVGNTLLLFTNFGRSGSTMASQLGGLNRLYQLGGARSHQFTVKMSF